MAFTLFLFDLSARRRFSVTGRWRGNYRRCWRSHRNRPNINLICRKGGSRDMMYICSIWILICRCLRYWWLGGYCRCLCQVYGLLLRVSWWFIARRIMWIIRISIICHLRSPTLQAENSRNASFFHTSRTFVTASLTNDHTPFWSWGCKKDCWMVVIHREMVPHASFTHPDGGWHGRRTGEPRNIGDAGKRYAGASNFAMNSGHSAPVRLHPPNFVALTNH